MSRLREPEPDERETLDPALRMALRAVDVVRAAGIDEPDFAAIAERWGVDVHELTRESTKAL